MSLKCLKPAIPTLGASTGSGWKPDTVRGTRHQRGYGWAWEQLRKRILERDRHLCQPCERQGITRLATAVDHIKPKAQGGTDAESNLQAICDPCHDEKTSRESRGGGCE